ncbi:septum formation initiator family protein [Ideonella sp. DXS29W]|uniref:Cell division protein FtsB n=1 Tax=Ideonella lacteola TaxID=2984193 RepID=A0ABU9BIS6_9BURK
MRLLPLALAALLLLVHAELWFGKGGIPHEMSLRAELKRQLADNAEARAHNDQLAAEVADLREGTEMVEEKARRELGMVRPDELLVVVSNQAR